MQRIRDLHAQRPTAGRPILLAAFALAAIVSSMTTASAAETRHVWEKENRDSHLFFS